MSYRLHKLGTPRILWTDGWEDGRSGPSTRPAFRQGDAGKKHISDN